MASQRWSFAWKLAVGVGLLALLLWQADLQALSESLSRVNVWIFVSLPVFYVHTMFKVLRWQVYLRSRSVALPTLTAYSIYTSGTFLGLISPGRVGEAYRAWVLARRKSASLGLGIASVVVDRLSDLIGLGIFGALGFLYLAQQGLGQVTAAAMAPLPGFTGRVTRYLKRVFIRVADRIPRMEGRSLGDEYADFVRGLRGFQSSTLLLIAVLTLLSIGTYCLHLYFIAYVLGLPLNFLEVVGVLSAATFINVLPISINGLGTRDAFLVMTLPLLGVDKDMALAYSLMFLLIFLANTLMSLPFWLRDHGTPLDQPPVSNVS